MTAPTLDAEPACPGAPAAHDRPVPQTSTPTLRATRRPFADIPRETWDTLLAANPWATPFSRWAFHRAWWDAYGANAHEETLVVIPTTPGRRTPIAIVPLMHRHEVEPSDAEHAHEDPPRPRVRADARPADAKAVFFGASYHADYATLLCAPADLPAVAAALADLARTATPATPAPWDAVDLRRLRCGDPAADALAEAFGRARGRARAGRSTSSARTSARS